jgi:hypothetical protein
MAPARRAARVAHTGLLAGWDAAACAATQPGIARAADDAMTTD